MSENRIKANLFKQALNRVEFEDIFEEIDTGEATGFKAFQNIKNGRCMILVIVDDSVYSTASVTFGTLDNLARKERILDLFNDLNQSYKTMKFYINDNNELVAQIGYTGNSNNFDADTFLATVLNMFNDIENNVYAKVMRILWA